MRVQFPDPPAAYSPQEQQRFRRDLQDALERMFNRFEDLVLANGERLVLTAPGGGRFAVQVGDGGDLSAQAVQL